ncbi:LysR family transcriptional regulator [Bordetella trematum]|uniref:LysR family transcriptional regulator n=1 Tax=Bordetella trematum TaxID=123899 RepID=UPI0013FD3070|nr:LysR family transcriptional regulator [Bordetella trematum]
MKLSHIDVCNAVLMTGSVTGAAKLLHLSQPAVTKLLYSAENQLGFKLFLREKNKLVPTAEALQLQPEFQAIAQQLDRLREHSRSLANKPTHVLRVACAPSIAAALIPQTLETFSQLFPSVSCEIEALTHDSIVQKVMQCECDVGLSLASLPNPALVEEVLASGVIVGVGPNSMMDMDTCGGLSINDLAHLPLIRVPPGGPHGEDLVPLASGNAALTISTNYLALRLAERGMGVALIDSFTAAQADRRHNRVLALDPAIPVRIYYLRAHRAQGHNAARRFVDIVAAMAARAHRSLTESSQD